LSTLAWVVEWLVVAVLGIALARVTWLIHLEHRAMAALYRRIFAEARSQLGRQIAVANDASFSPLKLNSMPENTAKYRQEGETSDSTTP
jgi:hypothetical protein